MGEYSMANAANVYYETPKFICKFPNLEETEKFQEQDTGSYSVTMCFSKEEVDAVEIEKKIIAEIFCTYTSPLINKKIFIL